MQSHFVKNSLKFAVSLTILLLLGVSVSVGQQVVNLTAAPTSNVLPDGTSVPMWGYNCGTITPSGPGCRPLGTGTWSPVVITVPSGQSLQINLTNNLSFNVLDSTNAVIGVNNIPTSLVIVGQLGGGLGTGTTTTPSPSHPQQGATWPITGSSDTSAGNPTDPTNGAATFTPPAQGPRVQSFATEVPALSTTTCPAANCASLTWNNLRPGSYLLESGTHPSIQGPMGLFGMVVVTDASIGTAYLNVKYNAELPLLFSEIDPTQNSAVDAAVRTLNFNESATLGVLVKGGVGSIAVTNGGSGYASAPGVSITGGGGSGATAHAVVDTVTTSPTYGQVTSIVVDNAGSNYLSSYPPTVIISGGGGAGAAAAAQIGGTLQSNPVSAPICSGGAGACYPPAVNYTPVYYLVNGQAFDKTNSGASLFAVSPAGTVIGNVTGNVLVRLVNAGLRMHVPSIVGSVTGTNAPGMSLIAEDGNVFPDVARAAAVPSSLSLRVQSEVFMAAGKTYDVMINAPAVCTPVAPATTCPALPIYDRQLSLSGGSINRDSGMLAYIGINGSTIAGGTRAAGLGNAVANPDNYPSLVAGQTFTVSDPSKGVIANDVNVTGVKVLTPPLNGQLTLHSNGTFTYVPSANGISLALTNGGSGYSAPAVVSISAPPAGGTQATATATVATGGIQSINVASGSSGYTAPTISFTGGGGSGAVATATLSYPVASILGGSGYVVGDALQLSDGVSVGTAAVLSLDGSGGVATADLTSAGNFASLPTVTDMTTPAASGAAATLASTGTITAITVSTPGTGYTTPPTVGISDSTGTNAAATAVLSAGAGTITAVNVTYIGSGYTSAPTVTIWGGTGSGAAVSVGLLAGNSTSDSFVYQANGNGPTAIVTLGSASLEPATGITCTPTITFTSNVATRLSIAPPGVLTNCRDGKGYPLTVSGSALPAGLTLPITGTGGGSGTVTIDRNGGFVASVSGADTYTFNFDAQNSQGTKNATSGTVTLTFLPGSGLIVKVLDGADKATQITDYRWIIEEDRTFYQDPKCTTNPPPAGCPGSAGLVPNFGTNFHTSWMPLIATGCTGPLSCEGGQTVQGQAVVCDVGNGICRLDLTGNGQAAVDPSTVHLDPTKRYYISVLPGDAANPFNNGYASSPVCSNTLNNGGQTVSVPNQTCGHGMGGAPIPAGQTAVNVYTQPTPNPPATLTVFVFEDDYPLNGEHDAGGGLDVLAPNEPGLGGFEITLFDDAGGTGDATGQPTYDMFNMPLTNSLAGTIDPSTQLDACPISPVDTNNVLNSDGSQKGIVGMIVTCPTYESDGITLSPLAGQALVNNLYQGRYGVVATPAADRIARGEEWLQTNTLDGQKAHDSFMRIGEPAYFQEFGPAGYHVSIGFANPTIINQRLSAMCAGAAAATCTNSVKGHITTGRMSRTPDERLYGSGTHDSYSFTQCYISLGDPDGAEFALTKCDADGNFSFTGIPTGNWKITTFDQWNDQVVDGISSPIGLAGNTSLDMGEVAVHQWQANIYTRTFVDMLGDGHPHHDQAGNDLDPGLPLVATNIRFRDGSYSNFNNTDLNGYAGFNEVFPLFNWYVVETDTTRYKTTGVHVVYDAGGPADGTTYCGAGSNGYPNCGGSATGQFLANTYENWPLPADLSLPGAVYCANADCATDSVKSGPVASGANSTGRIDPPYWFGTYGWQGFSGQNNFLEFGKKPYADATTTTPAENGGIHGHVVYASTRPFDDPMLLLQLSWEPLVPHVRVNLYKEGFAADGITPTLTLVDHTETTSFDDWVQGFHLAADGVTKVPNISCPGQSLMDPFFYALDNQPQWLDLYNNNGDLTKTTALLHNSQYKCYDGMHNWNQLQPAPYDGMYNFPSITSMDPKSGKPTGTNCDPTVCIPNPDASDSYRVGSPMLPAGKYVVEVVVPPGYELVKEEDKNILIGDNFIAPVTQQFGGLGSIFILPDQAEIASNVGNGNPLNPQNQTQNLGRDPNVPSHEGDTGSVETYWPCVGAMRQVPDYISLFPGSAEVSPFAGAWRPLCDRKEVMLEDQTSALAKFYIFTSTHKAAHFTGVITDDFTAEFDPFSPQFGEKFAPAYLPVSIRDWTGTEIARTYTDAWGTYNGLSYSTWEVNPPNPTGYGPTMMVMCMNDAGSPNAPDPLFQQGYSQFCYELPFMPGQTGYFDTPVVPTSAFAEGYNHADCAYPDATPAILSVTSSDIAGPWVANTSSGAVTAVEVQTGGSGYTSAPKVTIAAPTTGTQATAVAMISGSVNGAAVANHGNGYTGAPAVTFSAPVNGGVTATGTAVMTGGVSAVTVNSAGGGYTTAPGVSFNNAGTGGSGATATSRLQVVSISLNNAGTGNNGYNNFPNGFNFPITGQGCNGFAGTCAVVHVTVGSTAPRHITGVSLVSGGGGYTGRPGNAQGVVTISGFGLGCGGTGCGSINITNMSVASVTVTNTGTGYNSAPLVLFSSGSATATAAIGPVVGSITITNGGSGYTNAPTVTIDAPASGTRATATATFSASVVAVDVTNHGSGYTSVPAVSFNNTGTGGTGATAIADIRSGGGAAKLTITALGDKQVDNNGYTGPSASTGPFNMQRLTRHYGFGTAPSAVCNAGSGSATPCPNVTIGGHAMTGVTWTDGTITGTVPSGVPSCEVQQQSQYDGSAANCGELSITAANGKTSVDTVTVTIGGKTPTVLAAGQTIQSAIDAAAPGDMIILPANTYNEMVLMWKPVRLQGVGAESSVINANPHPQGFSLETKLDPWRRQVGCLFGLAMNGQPRSGNNPFDPSGGFQCPGKMMYFPNSAAGATFPNLVVDRVPMEGVLGWDTSVNGNLAEQLIEPSLMGAYEGAAITVLGKGVNIPADGGDPYGSGANESMFPAGSTVLTSSNCLTGNGNNRTNPYPSNFQCNPSSIDGLSLINSSQGGGGIFVHAWGHHLQIANNRVHSNQGTLSGGITVGQGEHTEIPLGGATAGVNNVSPGSCLNSNTENLALPYCYNLNVNVHHNSVTANSSLGDELFSSTPAGAGGVSFCNGADYYKFSYNWVCGNMNTGDGAGVAHIGYSYFGTIEHNTIIFNQSTNPTITTNGGGLLIMGAPDPDPACGSLNDKDCFSAPGTISPSDGTGPGLLVNANLIMGNSADAGSGGGVRLQNVNGTDVLNFLDGRVSTTWPGMPVDGSHSFQSSSPWNAVRLQNNIISNNVAGWDGGGISLLDALNTDLINNTIVSNDSTASSGVLFNSLFAPLASSSGPCPSNQVDPNTGVCKVGAGSKPQPAGLVSVTNSAVLSANMQQTGTVHCPGSHGSTGNNGTCTKYSAPLLTGDVIYQNRSFIIGVEAVGPGTTNQQYVVRLRDGLGNNPLAGNQTTTGSCPTDSTYWDIGVRGDTGPHDHTGGTLAPAYSVLSDITGYANTNISANPQLTSQYCNGSRIPPEACGTDLSSAACYANLGWQVPPGTNESNALPTAQFSLSPSATTDEGNNWINLRWGPLSLSNAAVITTPGTPAAPLADFHLLAQSPAIDIVPATGISAQTHATTDFYGNPRPDPSNTSAFDVGAIEFQGNRASGPYVYPTSLAFGNVAVGSSATQTLTLTNPSTATALTGIGGSFTGSSEFSRPALNPGTCGGTLAASTASTLSTCTINIAFTATTSGSANGQVTVGASSPVSGSPVPLTGTGAAEVFVSPTTVNFPNTRVGGHSVPMAVTITNSTASQLPGVTATFSTGSMFAAAALPGTCGAANPVAAGGTCSINVVFSPTAVSNAVAYLTITSSATVVGSPVTLNGTGTGASLSPSSLNFGFEAQNVSSGVQAVTLSNTDSVALNITGITIPAPFSRATGGNAGTCPNTGNLAAAGSCTIGVIFTPTAPVASNVNLTVAGSYATGSPSGPTTINSVSLSGSSFSVSPTSLAFGSQLVNTTSADQLVTVTNPSTTDIMGFSGFAVTSNQFGLATGTCSGSLAPGANCTVAVHFNPTSTGVKAGSMTITLVNPAGSSVETIASLGGTGFTAVSPTSLFGNQQVGTSSALQTITVTNPALAETLSISNIAFISGNSSQYSRQSTGANDCGTVYPKNLAGGTNCTIGVVFSPTSTGSKAATLRISLTQNTSTNVNVSLNGRGVNPVTVNPGSLTFGTAGTPIARGTNSPTQTITLTNPAGNPTFSGISLSFPTFFNRPNGAPGGTCGNNLNAGGSCTINVRYSPTAATPATNPTTGTLTINNTAGMNPSGPPTVGLTGYHN